LPCGWFGLAFSTNLTHHFGLNGKESMMFLLDLYMYTLATIDNVGEPIAIYLLVYGPTKNKACRS